MLSQPGLRAVNLYKGNMLQRLQNSNPDLAHQIRGLKMNWFTMRNALESDDADTSLAEVYIYDEIGGSFGVTAQDFVDQLNEITADEIVVRINSPGGMLLDAITISSALSQHPARIITRVDGMAASAASIIAIAGDHVEMMVGSQMMIHDVICTTMGNMNDMKEAMDWLNLQSENVASMYAAKGGGVAEDWRALMKAETWMFAEESVTSGLADAIYTKAKKAIQAAEDLPAEPDEEGDGEDTPPDPVKPDPEELPEPDDALDMLMNYKHKLTNRGYKYLGRNKAPVPAVNRQESFADLLDSWR